MVAPTQYGFGAVYPALIQASVGAWLSASILDLTGGDEKAARKLVTAGLTAAIPAVLTGAVDWSEQHEQQMRVGVVHAAGNIAARTRYAASLISRASNRLRCRLQVRWSLHPLASVRPDG